MPRVVVFIDNSNVYKRLADLCTIDKNSWCKQYDPRYLAEKLVGNRELTKVMFYCAPPPQSLFHRNPTGYASQNSYYDKVKTLPGREKYRNHQSFTEFG